MMFAAGVTHDGIPANFIPKRLIADGKCRRQKPRRLSNELNRAIF